MKYDIAKEKQEAIEAGQCALNSLRTARENLNSAKNWGVVDMLGGGFLTIFCHSQIISLMDFSWTGWCRNGLIMPSVR